MKLIRLGNYLELYKEKCNISNLTPNDVSGINRNKQFFEPSVQVANDTSDYKVVPPKYFSCNLMHVGRDKVLPISCNHTEKNKYVSPAYFVFKTKENNDMLDEYFFMYLKSNEKDRYFWFHTDSSGRDGMSWEDFCDIQIPLPPIEIQNKYVEIYKAMKENLKVYESNLEDLKLLKDILLNIDISKERIGNRIEETNEKNILGLYTKEKGISINKEFIETKAKASNIMTQKIVNQYEFAFNSNTSRNSNKISIAYNEKEPYILSNTYVTFKCNHKELSSKYLFLWFTQENFDRYARYNSWGSARETISLNEIKDYKIAIPELKVQTSIVAIFESYKIRESKVKKIRNFIDNICPILIAGAIKEAKANE